MASLDDSDRQLVKRRLKLQATVLCALTAIASLLYPTSAVAADVADPSVKVPPGSYQQTCVIVDVSGNDLRAICEAVNGDWLETALHNPGACRTDISNENGKLTCNRNRPAPPRAYSYAFGRSAIAFGERLGPWARMRAANWQIERASWTFKDGAPENIVALAQTTDGFLGLGGPGGLYRFDGRQFELFHSLFGVELLSTNISSLYAPASGGLWISYTFGGASFLDKGRATHYGGEFATHSGAIRSMAQDRNGIVWAASNSGLWRLNGSAWEHIGTEWNVRIKSVLEVTLDGNGDPLVAGDGMLLCLRGGSQRFQVVQENIPFDSLHLGYNGRLVDQEGNIWLSHPNRVDRIFYSPIVKRELGGPGYGFALAPDDGGVVWAGAYYGPLYRMTYRETGTLPKYHSWMVQFMYRAPDGTLWLGTTTGLWHETLSRQRPSKCSKQQDICDALWRLTGRHWDLIDLPSEVAGQASFLQAITQDPAGGMWVSLGRHGLYHLADGIWTPYGGRKDLQDLVTIVVLSEFTDSLGRVWFGCRRNQLAVLDGDRFKVFGPDDGLRVGNIIAIHGSGPKIWIGGEFGLQQFDSAHFKTINATDNSLLRGVSGIVETANGDLWLNGISGIFHIRQSELTEALNDSSYQVKGDHFGRRSGLPGSPTQIRPLPSAIEASDGRIWFALSTGVVSLDPARSQLRVAPPRITIQSVSANGKFYSPAPALRFPAHTSDVQISFAAVSLSDPEAIHFRYKLEETDVDWHEAAAASPVTYRNLAPGLYHFIVDATDTNGVWSDTLPKIEVKRESNGIHLCCGQCDRKQETRTNHRVLTCRSCATRDRICKARVVHTMVVTAGDSGCQPLHPLTQRQTGAIRPQCVVVRTSRIGSKGCRQLFTSSLLAV